MIQAIGLLIACYCGVRLLQVPIEHNPDPGQRRTRWFLSLIGLAGVGIMTLAILLGSTPQMR